MLKNFIKQIWGKIVSIKAGAEGMIAKAEGVVFLTTAYNLINISL